jgi:hypothetical protein
MAILTKFDDVYTEDTNSATLTIGNALSARRTPQSAVKAKATAGAVDKNIYDVVHKNGNIILKNADGNEAIVMHANSNTIHVKNDKENDTILLNGETAHIILGREHHDGHIHITDITGKDSILLDGGNGNLVLGGVAQDGDLYIKNGNGNDSIVMHGDDAELILGGVGTNGDLIMKNSDDTPTIHIYGSSGDIEFLNADFAEDFDICENNIDTVIPGSVMILDEKGKLIPCKKQYDPKVVGIIAGAGAFKPGIIMHKTGEKNRLPVAMVGKVYCLVDADVSPIVVGDMLTTSNRSGHAMKVMNKYEAFGTVIGKALSGLAEGKGLIPVLVNLQ